MEERGLTGPVPTKQHQHFSPTETKVDIGDRGEAAKALGDVPSLERRTE
jgi:hypothetical protein